MLDQDHHHGVEHSGFVRVWKPTEDFEKRHLSEIDHTDDFGAKVETVDLDLSGGSPGDIGFDLVSFHLDLIN